MKTYCFLTAVGLFMGGCAGVSITPISHQQAIDAHSGNSERKGYIVYEPVIVVEVSKKEVCAKKNEKGKCLGTELRCAAGPPFALPDYSKPYIIDIQSGFGKTGVELEIKDGWMLGKVKDNSDNAAVLGAIEKLLDKKAATSIPDTTSADDCKAPGLYRIVISEGAIMLEQLKLY